MKLQAELAEAQHSGEQAARSYQDLGEECFKATEKLEAELKEAKEATRCPNCDPLHAL